MIAERTAVLSAYRDWHDRFRLLSRAALAEVAERIREADKLLRRWLERAGDDHSVPATIEHLRRLLPRYCFKPDSFPPNRAGPSLGRSVVQKNQFIADMSKVVLPALRASPEYNLADDASSLRFSPRG
ncbi:MAG TPA: hypothetical protein VK988_11125 [Acidimicrobiales bacterium]|nr:hypothetical protein [Acidimicrobiales bacterium]